MKRDSQNYTGEIGSAGERRETASPKLQFEIFFGDHASGADAKTFLAKAKDADIIGFEKSGIEPNMIKLLRQLSAGIPVDYRVRQTDNWEFGEQLLQGIREMKKPVLLADLHKGLGSFLYDTYSAFHSRQSQEALLDFCEGNFDAAMRRIKLCEILSVKPNEFRERIIAARLEPQTKKLLKTNPQLRGKNSLHAIFFLGRAHTPIMHERSLPESARMGIAHAYLKTYYEQIYQLRRRKRDVPDELYARLIAESAIRLFLDQKYGLKKDDVPSFAMITNAAHLITRRMKENEIRELSSSLGKAEDERDLSEETDQSDAAEKSFFRPKQMDMIEALVEQKGMPLPSSFKELDTFISAHEPRWKL
ncbi:hypothetical protein HYV71_02155 [Candidatus Uhrbacteria bacterium]|nr:hypothetical protein [Candidatus Uhrbacteria bacterium]